MSRRELRVGQSSGWSPPQCIRATLVTLFLSQITMLKEGILRKGTEAQAGDLQSTPKIDNWAKSRTQVDLQRAYSLPPSLLSSHIVISNS